MRTGKLVDIGAIVVANYYGSRQVDPGTLRWQSPLASKDSDSMYTDNRFIAGLGATALHTFGVTDGMADRVVVDLGIAALGNLAATEGIRSKILEAHASNKQIGDQVRGDARQRTPAGFGYR